MEKNKEREKQIEKRRKSSPYRALEKSAIKQMRE
jgi:hypothetical protein